MNMKNQPEAAQIRLRQKVKKNELINDRDKTQMLQELQVYRRHFVSISRSEVERMNDNEAMEWQIRQTPGIRRTQDYGTSVGGFAARRVSEVAMLTGAVSTRFQIDSSARDITAIFSA